MESLGFVEVKGYVPAFAAEDAMVKSADVTVVKRMSVGAGLVTIVISGDVGAVRTAVDAGISAAKRHGEVAGCFTLARPAAELNALL